ncbi:hypothetical protein AAF712_004923 [Marasmius tenuissimus]|uniref:Uncharacterized protein n=1 Tax=Marasmius tenuissimus TaxID=585030 RepID=A0ABR3A398_9AGAR
MQPGAEPLFLCFFAIVFAVASAEPSQVRWISPSAGDYFGPGDNIVGKWSASKAVVSPSFELCTGAGQSNIHARDENNNGESGRCGAKTYPTIQQDNGVYFVSLTIPNVTDVQNYHLQMVDDFDNVSQSPSFSLSPSGSAPPPAANEEKVPPSADRRAQSPLTVSRNASDEGSAPLVVVTTNDPLANATPARDTANLGASHAGPPTAAYAVPISIVGAILLAATFVALRQNKLLGLERKADIEKIKEALSRSGKSDNSSNDIENAFQAGKAANGSAIAGLGMYGAMQHVQAVPIPLFMPPTAPLWPTKEAPSQPEDIYTRYLPPPRYSGRSSHRSPSVRSQVSYISSGSHGSATSRPIEIQNYSSMYSMPRPPSLSSRSSRSSRTRVCLPSIKAGTPLYDETSLPSVSRNSSRDGMGSDVTGSVLEDYMPPSPSSSSGPPPCLVPAPQRIHLREEDVVEKDSLPLVNPYDAVAASLRNGKQS